MDVTQRDTHTRNVPFDVLVPQRRRTFRFGQADLNHQFCPALRPWVAGLAILAIRIMNPSGHAADEERHSPQSEPVGLDGHRISAGRPRSIRKSFSAELPFAVACIGTLRTKQAMDVAASTERAANVTAVGRIANRMWRTRSLR